METEKYTILCMPVRKKDSHDRSKKLIKLKYHDIYGKSSNQKNPIASELNLYKLPTLAIQK